MLFNFALIISGIALLIWSADRFTDGAAAIARNFGVPPIIVGLTIVAMGSSAPELFVSGAAALTGNPELAVGNALGSNIANVGMVLGITALICPLQVCSKTMRREVPLLLGIMVLGGLLMADLYLSRIDGVLLLSGLVLYILWLAKTGREAATRSKDPLLEEIVAELPDAMPTKRAIIWILVGLILLPFSADLLVKGASSVALSYGVSQHIIGITVVAIGTSLPELAASVAGVLKKEHDIAIGNVIGSNIFNLLGVLGLPALISGVSITPDALYRDFIVMLILTVVLALVVVNFKGRPSRINRYEGAGLFIAFIGYMGYLLHLQTN